MFLIFSFLIFNYSLLFIYIRFIIVVISILIITYEKDYDDIDSTIKRKGMFLQIVAVLLSSYGIVLINMTLKLLITAFILLKKEKDV